MTAMVFCNVTLADTNSPVPLCHIGLCQKFTRAIQFMILNQYGINQVKRGMKYGRGIQALFHHFNLCLKCKVG
jgi:hypothetical protein